MSIESHALSYQAAGSQLSGYLAWDPARAEPRPGVLVIHEWWGHDEYVRHRARLLAELGYTAFAVDMYGEGRLADDAEEAQSFMMEVVADAAVMGQRFEAALAVLTAHETVDASRIASIGYCFGGTVSLDMARRGADLKGIVSFHGSLSPLQPLPDVPVTGKILSLTGADDPMITPEQVEEFKTDMARRGADVECVVYPGVLHGFTVPEATKRGQELGLPLAYDQHADRDSWGRMERFLESVL